MVHNSAVNPALEGSRRRKSKTYAEVWVGGVTRFLLAINPFSTSPFFNSLWP